MSQKYLVGAISVHTWVFLVGASLSHPALDGIERVGQHHLVRGAGEALQRGIPVIRVDACLVRQHGETPELYFVDYVEQVVRHGTHHLVDITQTLEGERALSRIENIGSHGEPEGLPVEVKQHVAADSAEHVEGVDVQRDGAVAGGGGHGVVALGAQTCVSITKRTHS